MNFTTNEAAVALLATAKVMLLHNVGAAHALSNEFDAQRLNFMMQEGMDGYRAEELLEIDLRTLIEFDPMVDDALATVNVEEEEIDPEDDFEPDEDRFLGGPNRG